VKPAGMTISCLCATLALIRIASIT
jgi:hypothetical protein